MNSRNNNISPSHKSLPVKVVVCTGGELKQDCQQDWTGYVNNNEKAGLLEYEFWGGDELAVYIEKYLFNENILPDELRSKFRKTLALLSDPDYNFSDYYAILDELLLNSDIVDIKKTSAQNKILKTFRTVNLCQNIININPLAHLEFSLFDYGSFVKEHIPVLKLEIAL